MNVIDGGGDWLETSLLPCCWQRAGRLPLGTPAAALLLLLTYPALGILHPAQDLFHSPKLHPCPWPPWCSCTVPCTGVEIIFQFPSFSSHLLILRHTHLPRIILVQLCLTPVPSPQAQHLRLRGKRHVHQTLKEPAFHDCSRNRTQHQSIVTHFHEPQCTRSIHPLVDSEALPVKQPRSQGLQVDVISVLKIIGLKLLSSWTLFHSITKFVILSSRWFTSEE